MCDGSFPHTEGRQRNGSKKVTPAFEVAGEQFEYHWYEHPGIGKVEVKRKRVNQA